MSVIVIHNGILKLYCKGADTTVSSILSKSHQPFKEFIDVQASTMSKKGLRSLYFAMNILPMEMKDRIPIKC